MDIGENGSVGCLGGFGGVCVGKYPGGGFKLFKMDSRGILCGVGGLWEIDVSVLVSSMGMWCFCGGWLW